MSFSNRRGRPRKPRRTRDLGTPELRAKREYALTAEVLDVCLERNLITPEQHWCGVHLRWLYTLRFGAPGVRAIDPLHMGGVDIMTDDPTWRAEREVEYLESVRMMGARLSASVLAVAVHNERPVFLLPLRDMPSPGLRRRREEELNTLQVGLERLRNLWCSPDRATQALGERGGRRPFPA